MPCTFTMMPSRFKRPYVPGSIRGTVIRARALSARHRSIGDAYLAVKLLIPFAATVLPVHAGSAPRGSMSEYGQAARADSCVRQEG